MAVLTVDNVLVHLVRDHKGVIPLCELRDLLHLFHRKYFSTGIRRITEDQCLRTGLKRPFQSFAVIMEIRRHKRHIDRICPGEDRVRPIVLIERAEHRDLISRIAHGHHRRHHRLRSPAGHNDLLFRIDLTGKFLCIHFCQRVPEILRPKGDGILVRTMLRRFL